MAASAESLTPAREALAPIEVIDATAMPKRMMGRSVLGDAAIDLLDLNPDEVFTHRAAPGRSLEIGTRLRWRC